MHILLELDWFIFRRYINAPTLHIEAHTLTHEIRVWRERECGRNAVTGSYTMKDDAFGPQLSLEIEFHAPQHWFHISFLVSWAGTRGSCNYSIERKLKKCLDSSLKMIPRNYLHVTSSVLEWEFLVWSILHFSNLKWNSHNSRFSWFQWKRRKLVVANDFAQVIQNAKSNHSSIGQLALNAE